MRGYKGCFKNSSKRVCIYIVIFVLFSAFSPIVYAKDEVVDQAKEILKSYYIDKLPEGVLKATTINEMLEYLKDPYTQHYETDQVEDYLNIMNMKFVGIGVINEMTEMGARVVSILPDSPALEAGIIEGDIIAAVNDNKMSGLSLDKAAELINGEEGIPLVLSISRRGEPISITIIPKKIPYPTVTGEVIDNDIGYIRINTFGDLTFNEFKYVLGNLRLKEVTSYIIDLRNNPGGYLKTVADIAGYFIGDNVAMVVQDRLSDKASLNATKQKDIINEPVAFLINDGSASASEILAAAIKDYKKGILVGSNTYGKGVAQSVFKLSDGSLLKATTLKFFSPFGEPIEGVGVKPDVKIANIDPLLAAKMLLRSINKYSSGGRYVSVGIGDMEFQIDLNSFNSWNQWETYRQIISNAAFVTTTINKGESLQANYLSGMIPKLHYAEVPKTIYKAGERVSFKLSSPGYGNKVQYRAVLYDEEQKKTYDLWKTRDNYYDKWKPNGDTEFTIGFPAARPGKYRIKIFVKRAGIDRSKTAIKVMECDSYVEEMPFVVLPAAA